MDKKAKKSGRSKASSGKASVAGSNKDKDEASSSSAASSKPPTEKSSEKTIYQAPPKKKEQPKSKGGGLEEKLIGLRSQNIVVVPIGLMSTLLAFLTFIGGIFGYTKLVTGEDVKNAAWNMSDCENHNPTGGYTDACTAFAHRKHITVVIIVVAILQFFIGLGTAVAGLLTSDKMIGIIMLPYVITHAAFGIIYVIMVVLLYDIYFRRIPEETYDYNPNFYYRPLDHKIRGKPYVEYDRFRRLWASPNEKKEQYYHADIVKFIVAFNAMFCLISCETLFGIGAVLHKLTRRRDQEQDPKRKGSN